MYVLFQFFWNHALTFKLIKVLILLIKVSLLPVEHKTESAGILYKSFWTNQLNNWNLTQKNDSLTNRTREDVKVLNE